MKKILENKKIVISIVVVLCLMSILIIFKPKTKNNTVLGYTLSANDIELVSSDTVSSECKSNGCLTNDTYSKTLFSDKACNPNNNKTSTANQNGCQYVMKHNTYIMQESIDKISNSGGGTLVLPEGTFYFSKGGTARVSNINEKYVIKAKNNVLVLGSGMTTTILKPYYEKDSTSDGGMDMFYFNNYRDQWGDSGALDSKNDGNTNDDQNNTIDKIKYLDINGNEKYEYNQTLYLINADFKNFTIDSENNIGGKYDSTGKGFMLNLFKDCDWENVLVRNTDGTGFGVDSPINSSMKNCIAIGNGKAATSSSGGASGFGIGTGYSDNESLIIEGCQSYNNTKYGYFFEHQAKFNAKNYLSTGRSDFVVRDSVAGGNLYDFGGEKANDVTYQYNTSVSGLSTYNGYSIEKNYNIAAFAFKYFSTRIHLTNNKVQNTFTDTSGMNSDVLNWGLNNGIINGYSSSEFNPTGYLLRSNAYMMLYRMAGYPGDVYLYNYNDEGKAKYNIYSDVDYTAENSVAKAIYWAYNYNYGNTKKLLPDDLITEDKKFEPDKEITRGQFISLLWKYDGSPSITTSSSSCPISDYSSYTNEQKSSICWAYNQGIINSTSAFNPKNSITRKDAITYMYYYNNSNKTGNKFTINYYNDSSNRNEVYYKGGETLTLPTDVKKDGYTFTGWTGSNGETPQKNVTISSSQRGNLVYVANFTTNFVDVPTDSYCNALTYNGSEQTLTKNSGVGFEFTNNKGTDAKSYTVTAKLKDGYKWSDNTVVYKTITCNIDKYNINNTSVDNISDKTYTGSEIVVEPIIKVGNNTLTKDKDYTYEISNNVNIGTASIVITGINNYTGTKTVNFKITKKEFTAQISNFSTNIDVNGTSSIQVTPSISSTINVSSSKSDVLSATTDNKSTITLTGLSDGYSTLKIEIVPDDSSYNTIIKKYNIKVGTPSLEVSKISINTLPNKTKYTVGETYDFTGLTLLVTYNDGSNEIIDAGYTVSQATASSSGEQTLTVTYEGFTTNFKVNVSSAKLKNIEIVTEPNKIEYIKDETIDITGLLVKANYEDGTSENLSSTDYTFSPSNVPKVGKQTITITYGDKNAEFVVNVSDPTVESYTVTSYPSKKEYSVNDTVDLTGLVITAKYNNGTNKKLTSDEYTINIDDKDTNVFSKAGTSKVIIKINGKTDTFSYDVTVKENKEFVEFKNIEQKDDLLYNFEVNMTTKDLLECISTSGTVNVKDYNDKDVSNDSLIGTGYKVKINLTKETKTYITIVSGDITKDGKINEDDSTLLYEYLRNRKTLDSYSIKAGAFTGNDKILLSDIARIYQYAKGKITDFGGSK